MSTIAVSCVEVGKVGDLKSGDMKMVSARGKEILLAKVGDAYYAVDNRCPHMGGNLSNGKLEGTIITCPRHQSQFDLRDGRVLRWTNWPPALLAMDKFRSQKRNLTIYSVSTEGEKIKVKV